MNRFWRLVDRHVVCLHCWDLTREMPSYSRGDSWHTARECLRRNR